jgi:hypothetical protein
MGGIGRCGGGRKGGKKERKKKEEDSLMDENSMSRKMSSCDSVWVV